MLCTRQISLTKTRKQNDNRRTDGWWDSACPQSDCVCYIVVGDDTCRLLILTLYMVIRPEEKERGVCKWMQTVCVCVWSTCLCLSCLWQVSEGSAPLRIRVCMCEYVWWLLMCVCVCMCVHAPMCTQVYMCGRNERQESHLLWCNDCAIWRQERFWCGSSWYLARWPFSIPPLTIWQMCQLDYFKRPWINKRLGESAACSPKESRGRRLHAHTHTHRSTHRWQ